MNSRDRLLATLNFETPDRVPFCDAYWPETIEAWRGQGLTPGASPLDLFGVDWRFVFLDTTFRLPDVVLEETSEHKLVRNGDGMTARFLHGQSTTPGFVSWLVRTPSDWEEYKPLLTPDRSRFSTTSLFAFSDSFQPSAASWDESLAGYHALRRTGRFLVLYLYDPWENLWRKLGVEQGLLAMATEPAWVHDICAAHTRLTVETVQLIRDAGVKPDGVMLIGDFASQRGLLISPEMYRQFVFPHHRTICDYFASLDVPVIFHCCGRVTPLIPDLIAAGVRALQPLSCKSGLELRQLKEEFGRKLVLMGNIDVRALAAGGDRLEVEVREKILCGKAGGGYVYHSDHSIPPDVRLNDYRRVVEIVAELGGYP